MISQEERTRLYENARSVSRCIYRRNLSRIRRRKNFYKTLERYYRNEMNPVEDPWKKGRRLARESELPKKQKEEENEEAVCEDDNEEDDDDDEEEEQEEEEKEEEEDEEHDID